MKKKKNPLKQNCVEDHLRVTFGASSPNVKWLLQEWCKWVWHGDDEMISVKWARMDRNGVVFGV